MEKIMTFLASRLSLLLIPAALLLAGTAMAMPPAPQGNATTITATADHGGASLRQFAVFIRGGCPYGLDKECHRNKNRKMVCRCVS
jgi:hypothetical protein